MSNDTKFTVIVLSGSDSIPDWVPPELAEEIADPEPYEERSVMLIKLGDKVYDHYDRGEPEDFSFQRDLAWVAPAIRDAYEFGRGDQTPVISEFISEVIDERKRQDEKWGGPEHDDQHGIADWVDFIMHHARRARSSSDNHAAERQMVRVAALALACVESMRRREQSGVTKPNDAERAKVKSTNLIDDDADARAWLVRKSESLAADIARRINDIPGSDVVDVLGEMMGEIAIEAFKAGRSTMVHRLDPTHFDDAE